MKILAASGAVSVFVLLCCEVAVVMPYGREMYYGPGSQLDRVGDYMIQDTPPERQRSKYPKEEPILVLSSSEEAELEHEAEAKMEEEAELEREIEEAEADAELEDDKYPEQMSSYYAHRRPREADKDPAANKQQPQNDDDKNRKIDRRYLYLENMDTIDSGDENMYAEDEGMDYYMKNGFAQPTLRREEPLVHPLLPHYPPHYLY